MEFLQHLSNCHGEWQAIGMVLGSLPFVGVWIKHLCMTRPCKKHEHKDEYTDGGK